jgi:hypothetical protein
VKYYSNPKALLSMGAIFDAPRLVMFNASHHGGNSLLTLLDRKTMTQLWYKNLYNLLAQGRVELDVHFTSKLSSTWIVGLIAQNWV